MSTLANPGVLKPHPKNAELYNKTEGESWHAFLTSIKEKGVLEPIVVTDNTNRILSGHRRHRAALELGLVEVPVTFRHFTSEEDEWEALIEYNRYRDKTTSEKMREATLIEEVAASRAKQRQGARTDIVENLPECDDMGKRTRDVVAEAIGVSGRQYDKLKTVFEAGKTNPKVAQLIQRIDEGSTSVDSVYKYVKSSEDKTWLNFNPKAYNYWFFGQPDTKYGNPHPGQLHPGIVENLLWFYTDEKDLVVDPFAGGGITIDVCREWGRRCLAYDIDPRRDDILHNDVMAGYPVGASGASLVVLDPPYWNMVGEEYSADGAGSYDLADFVEFLKVVAHNSVKILKPGGYVAGIIMGQYFRLPPGVPMIDWPFVWYKFFVETGATPVARIYNMWPTSIWQPFHVSTAKLDKRMLPIMGDLMVFQKKGE